MRILHTSDWHLGRSFHGVNLLEAQVQTLSSLVELVRSESIEVVVIAGDIYDRAVPGADAVRALSHLLSEIRGAGARIVGISGNHDSADRIGFAEPVMAAAGVSLRGDIRSAGEPVIIPRSSGNGSVAFYPIPYLEVERSRHALDAPDARSHEKLLSIALDRSRTDLSRHPDVRSVAVAHAFVTGGQGSDSELALSVGGSDEVPLRNLRGFDYVALGHLHGRQSFASGNIRYSGSPLAYSFSERSHVKGGWIVDVPKTGDISVREFDFPVARRLHQIRGSFETLLNDASFCDSEDGYVQAVVTDTLLPSDAMGRLQKRFPLAVHLLHEPATPVLPVASYRARVRGRTDLELAVDFVEHIANRMATAEEVEDLSSAIDTQPAHLHTEVA
jgi:DNA repair protein SbcD/Mre11